MITILQYNPLWPAKFEEEKKRILRKVGHKIVAIEHVGSTSIKGMSAKPTIDICIVVDSLQCVDSNMISKIKALGYQYLPELEKMLPDRRYFQLLDEKDSHLFHLHIVEKRSQSYRNYVLFRNYLRQHASDAKAYEALKYKLGRLFQYDRESYTNGKVDFIQSLLKRAAIWDAENCLATKDKVKSGK